MSVPEKEKVAEVLLVGLPGTAVKEVFGGVVSMTQVWLALLAFVAGSVAVTVKVCEPGDKVGKVAGLAQGVWLTPSNKQVSVAVGSELVKVICPPVLLVGLLGPPVMATVGGVASMVQL